MTTPTDIPALIERLRARGSEPYLGNDYLWHAQLEPIFAEAATALASMAEQVEGLTDQDGVWIVGTGRGRSHGAEGLIDLTVIDTTNGNESVSFVRRARAEAAEAKVTAQANDTWRVIGNLFLLVSPENAEASPLWISDAQAVMEAARVLTTKGGEDG